MRLNHDIHGSDGPTLLIVHGLFGSARNWGVIAKRLSSTFRVVTPDLRNHGLSPWDEDNSYLAMAEDLAALITDLGPGPVHICGHSMGGKTSMALALTRPDLVDRLIIADIAPVHYPHSQIDKIDAMRKVDPTRITRRTDAKALLEAEGIDAGLQSFFTQSLDLSESRWRLNLEALARNMEAIMDFPTFHTSFDGSALFLAGADSNYLTPEFRPDIRALFPKARFAKLTGAGHWLHADKPREFEATIRAFLAPSPQET